MGHKILGETVGENYKTKSTRKTALEEQHVFEGAIPAIIDEETWNTVQRLQETKRRPQKHSNVTNHLTGILYCADCGSKLTHRHTLSQKKWIDDSFVCSSYRHLNRFLHANLPEGVKSLPIAKWEKELAALTAENKDEYEKLKESRAEVAELQKIRRYVDVALKAETQQQTQIKRHEHDL